MVIHPLRWVEPHPRWIWATMNTLARNKGPGLAALASFALSVASAAAQTQSAPAASAPPASVQADYHPSMGDLMTMAVQPRHIKLGLSGRQGNWPYASYELNELRNAFARIGRTIPKYQNVDTAEIMTALTKSPLDVLEQAIAMKDAAKFNAAYAQLTLACNACHQSQKHAAIVIKSPDAAMYPDQDFRPVAN
jgi:hypothetical protein